MVVAFQVIESSNQSRKQKNQRELFWSDDFAVADLHFIFI